MSMEPVGRAKARRIELLAPKNQPAAFAKLRSQGRWILFACETPNQMAAGMIANSAKDQRSKCANTAMRQFSMKEARQGKGSGDEGRSQKETRCLARPGARHVKLCDQGVRRSNGDREELRSNS